MTPIPSRSSLSAAIVLALTSSGAAPAGTVAAASVPGGLYVGYYQEDPLTNPEDPTPGAFVLDLPEQDGAFGGEMYFTYVGCQGSNVGQVKGTKAGLALSGTWSGTIDGSPQSGPYSGHFDRAIGGYGGVYADSGGKQSRDIAGCIHYVIAPNGTWEMFPVEHNQPAAFKIAIAGAAASWAAVPGAAMSLVYVLDPALARSRGGNAVKLQTVLPGPVTTFDLAPARLTPGRGYVVIALVNDARARRIAIASKRFTAP